MLYRIGFQIPTQQSRQLFDKRSEFNLGQITFEHPHHLDVVNVLAPSDPSTIKTLVMGSNVTELNECFN